MKNPNKEKWVGNLAPQSPNQMRVKRKRVSGIHATRYGDTCVLLSSESPPTFLSSRLITRRRWSLQWAQKSIVCPCIWIRLIPVDLCCVGRRALEIVSHLDPFSLVWYSLSFSAPS